MLQVPTRRKSVVQIIYETVLEITDNVYTSKEISEQYNLDPFKVSAALSSLRKSGAVVAVGRKMALNKAGVPSASTVYRTAGPVDGLRFKPPPRAPRNVRRPGHGYASPKITGILPTLNGIPREELTNGEAHHYEPEPVIHEPELPPPPPLPVSQRLLQVIDAMLSSYSLGSDYAEVLFDLALEIEQLEQKLAPASQRVKP